MNRILYRPSDTAWIGQNNSGFTSLERAMRVAMEDDYEYLCILLDNMIISQIKML